MALRGSNMTFPDSPHVPNRRQVTMNLSVKWNIINHVSNQCNPVKLDYSLRTLHHNLIELGHFFAAIALQLLSYIQCSNK